MKLTAKEKIKVRKMTLTDKKKIEKALEVIADFDNSVPMTMFDIQSCHQIIKKIKEILEE